MRLWRGACFLVLAWLLGTTAGPGQLTGSFSGDADRPKPPPSHVLDVAGLFDRHPDELAIISGMLKSLEEEHGMGVYLTVHAGLLQGGVEGQARRLFDTWVGEGTDGLVLVYDMDSRELDVGRPLAALTRMESGEVLVSRLPEAELMPILLELRAKVADREDQAASLVEMTGHLATRLGALLSLERKTGPDAGAWKIAWITLSAGGILALLGWLLNRVVRGADVRAREQFHFPDVLVGVRLGAQCGGGRVAVRRYGEQQRGEESGNR